MKRSPKNKSLAERIFDIGQRACARQFHPDRIYKWTDATP